MRERKKDIGLMIAAVTIVGLFFAAVHDPGPFGMGREAGRVQTLAIREASGLIASASYPDCFWTHNDSGDGARVFLLDSAGQLRATVYLRDIVAYDWEDIDLMTVDGRHDLLVGDIGDNAGARPFVSVHRFTEPSLPLDADKVPVVDTLPRSAVRTYMLRYADGPRDAESLFFDPIDQLLYVISKRELEVGLYGTVLPEQPHDTLVLRRMASIPMTFITSATVRPDGAELLVKNLLNVYYWKRLPGETLPAMVARPALRLPYRPEPQGEAIAFARRDHSLVTERGNADGYGNEGSYPGYYTLSEAPFGLPAILYFYPRKHQ